MAQNGRVSRRAPRLTAGFVGACAVLACCGEARREPAQGAGTAGHGAGAAGVAGQGDNGTSAPAESGPPGVAGGGGDGTLAGAGGAPPGSVAGGAGGQAGAAGPSFECGDPRPLEVDGVDTGFVRCTGGWLHRARIEGCPERAADFSCNTENDLCQSDADCNEQPRGRCLEIEGLLDCACSYGCNSDSECAPGQICECGEYTGRCVDAQCGSDADCGEGYLCRSTLVHRPEICADYRYVCQSEADTCQDDGDCSDDEQPVCVLVAGALACEVSSICSP